MQTVSAALPGSVGQDLTVIINIRARAADHAAIAQVERAFERARLPVRFERVSDPAAIADRAASAAAREDILIAAGGDGTASAIAAVAVETGAMFGVIPLGTLNHFARDIGVPTNIDEAVATIAALHGRPLDVGEVNGRVFLNNSSIGLYPRLVWEREQEQRRGRGKWTAFGIALVRTWRRYRTVTARLIVDGRQHVRRTPFVFIGNNEYVAEGLQMGGRSTIDAGRLSLYIAPHCGRFEILALPFQALAGRLATEVKFESFVAREVTIEPTRPRVNVSLDGELALMSAPLRYCIRPAALRAIVPT
jgi:diacylglycerol kinase family enzyme